MTRGVQLVRLLASVAISILACCFVVFYRHLSVVRLGLEHPNAEPGLGLGILLSACGDYMYIVPIVMLLIGLIVIWRWPNLHLVMEIIVSGLWVMALLWAGIVVLYGQLVMVPIFHGMQAHYVY